MRNTGVYRFNQQVVWWLFRVAEQIYPLIFFLIPIVWLFNGKA